MSTLVATIISDAARDFGDFDKLKVTDPKWILYYNDATEYLSLHWKVLEQDASHDVEQDEDRYLYPDDCVQMKGWQYNPTPTDSTAWQRAKENFEDEDRNQKRYNLPTGDSLYRYLARAQFFQITPRPTALVTDGGLLQYWKLAKRVTDPTAETFELPAAMRLLVRKRMLLEAKQGLYRYDQYEKDLIVWNSDVDRIFERFEDRSDDRRSRVRLRTAARGYRGMN